MPFSPPVPQAASRKSRQDAVREQEASCGEPGALLGSQRRWNWTVSQARESSRVRQRTLSRDGAKHPEVHGVTCVSSGELLNPRGAWVSSCENCTPDPCLGWGSVRGSVRGSVQGVCGGWGVCEVCAGCVWRMGSVQGSVQGVCGGWGVYGECAGSVWGTGSVQGTGRIKQARR